MMRFFCLGLLILNLVACDSKNTQNPDFLSSQTGNETLNPDPVTPTKQPGVTLEGGDQGREGGHFLICMPEGQIPDSRTKSEKQARPGNEKVIFVDYFLTVKHDIQRKRLFDFHREEDDALRLDMVTKRLLQVFDSMPEMKKKAVRMVEYSQAFMGRKGRARWIESTDIPFEHELTTDFTPKHLEPEDLDFVNQYCQSRFFQAAVYDYSVPGDEVFYYSEFFEEQASAMQKSFRNIHELLRFMMRHETPQVIQLTHYFHTDDFFKKPIVKVRQKIAAISHTYKSEQSFYEN